MSPNTIRSYFKSSETEHKFPQAKTRARRRAREGDARRLKRMTQFYPLSMNSLRADMRSTMLDVNSSEILDNEQAIFPAEIINETFSDVIGRDTRHTAAVLRVIRKNKYLSKKSDDELLKTPIRTLFHLPEITSESENFNAYMSDSPRLIQSPPQEVDRDIPHVKSYDIRNMVRNKKTFKDKPPLELTLPGILKGAALKIPPARSKHIDGNDPISVDPFEVGEKIVQISWDHGRNFSYMTRASYDSVVAHWATTQRPATGPLLPDMRLPMVGKFISQFTQLRPESPRQKTKKMSPSHVLVNDDEVVDDRPLVVRLYGEKLGNLSHRMREALEMFPTRRAANKALAKNDSSYTMASVALQAIEQMTD
jgi:hypothetical protein